MNEAYVSFGVAKLLKEKGFDWDTDKVYERSLMAFRYEDYPMPTQAVACRWLREVHKIDISVTPDDGSWWIKVTELESWSIVFNGKVLTSDDIKFAYQGSTNTKEECYEAGLWYVLKKLDDMSRKEDFDKFVENTADTISHQWGTDGLTYADLVDAGDKCVEYGYQYAIDKACEWLKEYAANFVALPNEGQQPIGDTNTIYGTKSLLYYLRKAMEELL